jgi:mannan endo-1,4-beta-mannosidase
MRIARSLAAMSIGISISLLAVSTTQAQTNLFDKCGWVVAGADDTAPNPREIQVSVEGQGRGKFTELKIHYKTSGGAPQVFSVKGSGALRPVLLASSDFGGTFYATGYWDAQQGLIQNLRITELDIRCEEAYPNSLRLAGKASNLSSLESADFMIIVEPPSAGAVRVAVSYTLVATREFSVDQTRQSQREGFRLARIASSFISTQTHDSDRAVYLDTLGKFVSADLRNENGFALASPQPLGKSRLALLHTSSQPRRTPNLAIWFIEPAPAEITPQGYVTKSSDPNDDNVDFWGNWDRAKTRYAQGERLGRFSFVLEATPPSATPPSFDELAPVRDGEFVVRAGNRLMLGNQPFRFAGNNTYYLQPEVAYNNLAGAREALDKMATMGLTVARAIGFNDHPSPANNSRCPGMQTTPAGNDPAAIQFSPGVFCEQNLVALDIAVAEARARNVRLILYLTNNFTAYGGIRRYVYWRLNREPSAQEIQLFYTDATIRMWFRNYVSMLLNRRNTVTDTLYRDEPAILAWELGNELRNEGGNAQVLLDWMKEMAAHIKSIDQKHLVGDGGEGFDNDPNRYPGLSNPYTVRGDTGNSFRRILEIPELDLGSYHLYPASWGLNDAGDVEIWIREHERMAREAGKVAYLGEYGKRPSNQDPPNCDRAPGRAFDTTRAQIYDRWLDWAVCSYGTSGHLLWQLVYDARPDCDGFAAYHPEDRQTTAVLLKYAGLTVAPPISTVSAASYGGAMLAPESIAAVFGTWLSDSTQAATTTPLPFAINGTRASVTDSAGAVRNAPLFFASLSQINLQIPPGASSGSATLKILRDDRVVACGAVTISSVAPGLFTANASGAGVPAAIALRYRNGQEAGSEPVFQFDGTRFVPRPVDIGPEGDQVFLVVFGTGIRLRSLLSAVTCNVGGANAEVFFAGPTPGFVGLDQANILIPRSLAGRGEVDVILTVEGKAANMVRIAIK